MERASRTLACMSLLLSSSDHVGDHSVANCLKLLPLQIPCHDGLLPGTVSQINPFSFKLFLSGYFITEMGEETKTV